MSLYASTARRYRAAGWSPIPLPAGRKAPPPGAWTGAGAPHPSGADVEEWCAEVGDGNLGVRLPAGTVGLDVDAYTVTAEDGTTRRKRGADTMRDLIDRLGPLPRTIVSSRRLHGDGNGTPPDPVSGIRVYRLPPGVTSDGFPNTVGPDVEVIREGHRYAVAAPSVVDGLTYATIDYRTGEALDVWPAVDTLPELPAPWVEHLTRGATTGGDAAADPSPYLTPGRPCRAVSERLGRAFAALDDGASRHDHTAAAALKLVRLGEQGHTGTRRAVDDLRAAFVDTVAGDRHGGTREAHTEYRRMIDTAAAKVTADPTPPERRRCCEPLTAPADEPVDDAEADAGLVNLATVTPERVDWLWPGYMPRGKLVTLDGDPGLGKSTLALTFAAHVTTGRPWPDGQGCPSGSVLVLSAEDGLADTIRPRLDVAGADPTRVDALRFVLHRDDDGERRERLPVLPGDVARIERIVAGRGVALVIVDVLMAYLDGSVNAHRDQDVRRALAPLAGLAERTGATVLVLRHLNKSPGGPVVYRGGGSIGIVGAARVGLITMTDPDDDTETRRMFGVAKSNLAARPPVRTYRLTADSDTAPAGVEWLGVDERRVDELMNRGEPGEATETADASAWLVEYLTDCQGSAPAEDVKRAGRATGFSIRTIERARERAGVESRRHGFGKGAQYVWTIDLPSSPHVHHDRQASELGAHAVHEASMDAPPCEWTGCERPAGAVLDGYCDEHGATLTLPPEATP